jgi:hypothetical protein
MRALLHRGFTPKVVRDEKAYDPMLQHRIQDALLGKLKGFEGDPSDIIGR